MTAKVFASLRTMFGLCAALAASLFQVAPAPAQTSADVYASDDAWLCRPGRADACAVDQDATIVSADGTMTREAFHADPAAPIDCFYVYPTVSYEPTGNSDMAIDAQLRRAVAQQFARFGSRCRLFAPVYRQITLKGLLAAASGHPVFTSRDLAYADVLAAWKVYLARDNNGRGYVLIGHSQGSSLLAKLIRNEIDGRPEQTRLVSAILMGVSLPIPSGVRPDLPFPHMQTCRANDQTGCVIAFADFRAEAPPPAGSLFVQAPAGMQSACANPAALEGGEGRLDAYLSTSGATVFADAPQPIAWTEPPQRIDTPFVKVPGLLTARCVANENGAYLAVTLHPEPEGRRIRDVTGDVIAGGKIQREWGLHLIDANLNMGNLIAIVGDQSRAYLAKTPK